MVKIISHVQVRQPEDVEAIERQRREAAMRQAMEFQHANASGMGAEGEEGAEQPEQSAGTVVRDTPKVGRNDPCPCGSGKKYKACHGKLA